MGASALAVFDPNLGAVVIDSHSPRYRAGDTITMQWSSGLTKPETIPSKRSPLVKVIQEAPDPPTGKASPRAFRARLRKIKGKYLYSNIKETQKVRKWMDKTGYFKIPDKEKE